MTQHTSQAPGLDPVAVTAGEGEARWFGGLAVVKAAAAETGGQMTILEITEPPNGEGPLHVHHTEDEGFRILEGSATFEVGDQTIAAGAGDYVFGPRDIPHRYMTGPNGCRMLFIFTSGFEEVMRGPAGPPHVGRRTVPTQTKTPRPPTRGCSRCRPRFGHTGASCSNERPVQRSDSPLCVLDRVGEPASRDELARLDALDRRARLRAGACNWVLPS